MHNLKSASADRQKRVAPNSGVEHTQIRHNRTEVPASVQPRLATLADGDVPPAPVAVAPTSTKTLKRPLETDSESAVEGKHRPVKRTRYKEPPIWAQKAKHTAPLQKQPTQSTRLNVARPQPPSGNGPARVVKPSVPQIQHAQAGAVKSSNPWKPFNDTFPHEELSREIANFLFMHVVSNDAFDTINAGGSPSPNGALEIEAKLGTLIDRSSNMRVNLPVRTETVLADGYDVAFESTMTEVSAITDETSQVILFLMYPCRTSMPLLINTSTKR